MENINPKIEAASYFTSAASPLHRQFLALRMFFVDGCAAEQVALAHGYSVSTVYSLIRDFKEKLADGDGDPFFKEPKPGRPRLDPEGEVRGLAVSYRKQHMSVPEIKAAFDAQGIAVSERSISSMLADEGFARLPRRGSRARSQVGFEGETAGCAAPKSGRLGAGPDRFSSQLAGLLLFLPVIRNYGIDKLILGSKYPETSGIDRLSSILSYLALKLSSIERYGMDDAWCMDRGMGLFAGLNVLPKTAWFSSYSSGVTREMNLSFLGGLRSLWREHGLLSDTVNLDFTAIPYWGDDDPFENNWSGKRTKALASIQAALAQDPDSGLLCYSDTTVRHSNESDVVMEFLDFYHNDPLLSPNLKCLVFDSRFTTYRNLSNINKKGFTFITVQRRSKHIEDKVAGMPDSSWKGYRIMRANGKGRTVTASETRSALKDYDGEIRQVFIKGAGKIKPAVIITNDFDISLENLVRKYSRRWLIEKGISEQISFFHLNRNCSGIVVKVDFDLVMTVLAHNLYRLFAQNMAGYSHCEAKTLFTKFILNAGEIAVSGQDVIVKLKRKRTLSLSLDYFSSFEPFSYPWLHDKNLHIMAANYT